MNQTRHTFGVLSKCRKSLLFFCCYEAQLQQQEMWWNGPNIISHDTKKFFKKKRNGTISNESAFNHFPIYKKGPDIRNCTDSNAYYLRNIKDRTD